MASDDRNLKPHDDAAANSGMVADTVSSLAPSTATFPKAAPGSILVLGMHRSGTSAVARVLGLMGADPGPADELLPAHPTDNPTGYWERGDLNAIHDRLLDSTGHAWNRVAGFDPHALDGEACAQFAQQLRSVVKQLATAGRPWLAKDPRLCLLLSQWRPLLDTPAFIVVVRDPREVAASMSAGPRGTFTSPFVIALWEKYLRTLLADLAGTKALFVSYADLLAHAQTQCKRMLRGLTEVGVKGLHEPADSEIKTFLDPQLKRSEPKAHVQLSAGQAELLKWLETQCHAKGVVKVAGFPQAPAPDAVLAEFQAAFDFHLAHGRALANEELKQHLGQIEAQLAAHAAERERQNSQLAQEREQHAQNLARAHEHHSQDLERERVQHARNLTREHEQYDARLAAQQHSHAQEIQRERELRTRENEQHAVERASERDAWAGQLDATRQQLDAMRQQSDAATQALAQVRVDLAHAQHAGEMTHARLEQLTAHSNAQDARVHELNTHASAVEERERALRASLSWRITAPLRGVAGLFQLRPGYGIEQRIYRAYYGLPGFNATRKRNLITWLHRHVPWLTRHTLSYQLYEQAEQLQQQSHTASPQERERLQRMDAQRAAPLIAALADPPLISIVMPVYNVERRWLLAAVESVRRQFYPHWELCIADDASMRKETREALGDIAKLDDARIRIHTLSENLGIAGASNAALQMATGTYVGLLDNDDELARDALLEMACRIAADNPDVLYSDEDKLDTDGMHVEPNFKPDFNLDYFFSINYVCHFTVIRRSLLEKIGGFRAGFEGSQDYDLLLRATENGECVAHVPSVLYHWRKIAESTASSSSAKPKSWDAGCRALEESITRRGIAAEVVPGPYPNTYRVRRPIAGQPLVSILVPFRDKPELLSTCVQSILAKTDYPHYEIVGLDNGSVDEATHTLMRKLERRDSRVRFARYDEPFNYSAINNFGARQAQGEHLLLLNNDTEVIAAEWLRAMLEHSQRPEVGVVGAKLLYPDRRIQHAGVIVGIGGVAGHSHLFADADHPGYFARAQLPQNLSAVTFACAMTRRAVFEQLDGLNERDLTIAFNDIDYCLRAREAGYLIVYTPFAQLFHHESLTRGYEDNPEKQLRFGAEIRYMQERHREILEHGDPCYNPNLRLDTHDFSPLPGYVDALPL